MSRTRSLSKLIGPSGSQAFDTNTLVIDAANNKVGIGTTAPSSLLTVAGTSDLAWSAATSKLQISRSGAVARLQNYENGSASTNLALQWEGGNVGIGTSLPPHKLSVEQTAAGTIASFFDTGSNGGAMYNGAAVLGVSRVSNGSTSLNGPIFQVGRDNSSSTSYNIDDVLFSVNSTGVGIGTSSPQTDLHVHDSAGLAQIRLSGTASDADTFQLGQGTTGVTNGGFTIRDVEASADRLVINSLGKVGIGTSSPTHKLDIISDGGAQLRIAAWDQSTTARANIDFWYLDAGGSPYNNAQISTLAAANAGNGNLVFSTRPTSGSLTEAMTITSDRVTIPQYLQPIKYKPNIQWQAVTGGFTTGCSANTWYSITNFDVNSYNSDRAAGARGLWFLIYWTSGNVNRGYNHTVTGHIPTMGSNAYIGYQNGSYVTSAIGSAQYSGLPIQVSHHTGCPSGHIIETRVWGNGTSYGELNIQIKAEGVPDAAGAYISVWRV